jgi:hypothetical protein
MLTLLDDDLVWRLLLAVAIFGVGIGLAWMGTEGRKK